MPGDGGDRMASVTATSETAAILPVVYLVHVPLHQAVELHHGIFDQRQRAGQDPQEVATKGLLDPVRFEGLAWLMMVLLCCGSHVRQQY
jgi:hypothetical protein